MPRAGLSTETVVKAAAELADERGLEAVTLAALAERLGVRSPSLYSHVGGLEDLRGRLAARGSMELAQALQDAATGRAGSEALSAIAEAYRRFARSNPGSNAALQHSGSLSSAEAHESAARVLEVVLAVLRGYGLEGEQALHMVRALRATLHGFVSLEAEEGFGLSLSTDESFTATVALIDLGLRSCAQEAAG